MKIGSVTLSRASLLVLGIQLAVVCSIAGKYLYQRWACPRAWVQVVGYDPELLMRGRYLSLQVLVDGCGSTLPSGKSARFPRNVDGTVQSPRFSVAGAGDVVFRGTLSVRGDRLAVLKVPLTARPNDGLRVLASPNTPCDAMRLAEPVNFYLPERAASPLPLKQGTELWMQVTVPPNGPPRPIALALKREGVTTLLAID